MSLHKKLKNRIIKYGELSSVETTEVINGKTNFYKTEKYILDISSGYLFYYPQNGKILLSEKGELNPVFRSEFDQWMNDEEIKKLLKETLKIDIV